MKHRYFEQRPAPGCFHAVSFGTCYSPRGAYPGCTGAMLDLPESVREERTRNVLAQGGREMFIAHDGGIVDIFGTAVGDLKPGVYPRSTGIQFPKL